MIKENNAVTFTKRLNYTVSEVTVEEFLSVLSNCEKNEKNKALLDNIESKFSTGSEITINQ
jgi:hypothetical protein